MSKLNLTKQQIEGLIIGLILLALLIAGTHRFSLSDYEEECYQYKQIPYIVNFSYQDYKDGRYCIGDTSGYWHLNCSIVTKYYFYNSTKNGNCIKYHLVRKV